MNLASKGFPSVMCEGFSAKPTVRVRASLGASCFPKLDMAPANDLSSVKMAFLILFASFLRRLSGETFSFSLIFFLQPLYMHLMMSKMQKMIFVIWKKEKEILSLAEI